MITLSKEQAKRLHKVLLALNPIETDFTDDDVIHAGLELGNLTQTELQRIEDWVNNYPRRIFGYKSAYQIAA